MECPICLDPIATRAILKPCGHSFCSTCLEKCLTQKLECPLCRSTPYAVDDCAEDRGEYECMAIRFFPDAHAGVTVVTSQRGVRIVRLDKNDLLFAHGLRVGDEIVAVNNIACVTHEAAVKVLDSVSRYTKTSQTMLVVRMSVHWARRPSTAKCLRTLIRPKINPHPQRSRPMSEEDAATPISDVVHRI